MKNNNTNTIISTKNSIIILVLYFVFLNFVFPYYASKIALYENPFARYLDVKYQVTIYLITFIPVVLLSLKLFINERKFSIKKLFFSIFLSIIFCIFINILFSFLMSLFGGPLESNNQNSLLIISSNNKLLFVLMVVLLAPTVEEIVFRGVIFKFIKTKKGFVFAAIISSLLFGFIHIYSSIFNNDFSDLVYLFLYGGLGFIFCISYEYNETIYAPILLHMCYNLFGCLSIICS